MKTTTKSLILLLTLSVSASAQVITLPALPSAAIKLFQAKDVSFEVQTAAMANGSNSMSYWQGTVTINATGGITGNAGIGSLPNGANAVNSTVTSTNLSGSVFRPRVAWTFVDDYTDDGVKYKYRSADYVADLFVRTNPAGYIIKGALVYRLRQSYYYDPVTKKTVLSSDDSFVDVRACAFGNNQVGFVSLQPN